MENDLITVYVYKQLGAKPSPGTDTLIGQAQVYPEQDPSWALSQISLPAGTTTLYTISEDRVGNTSRATQPMTITMQD